MSRLIIIGASGHGKVIADIAARCGYTDIAFLDDNPDAGECMGYSVIGKSKNAKEYPGAKFIVAIGNPEIRQKILEQLENMGLTVISLVHPNAVIAEQVEIGKGTVVMAGAIINPACKIGKGCIVNTGASVDHDNVIDDYVHISVGSHLAGNVKVGTKTWIGAGAVVNNDVKICSNCIIGSGAAVVKNIDEPGIFVGVPDRKMVDGDDMNNRNKILRGVILSYSSYKYELLSDYTKMTRRMAA